MKNYLIRFITVLLVVIAKPLMGQGQSAKTPESKVILSESSISSLAATLKVYKDLRREAKEVQPSALKTYDANSPINGSSLETMMLKQDIANLEHELAYKTALVNRTAQNKYSTGQYNANLKDMKDELSELQFKINQLQDDSEHKPAMLTSPVEISINRDSSNVNVPKDEDAEVLLLQQQLDSLYANLKTLDGSEAADYSGNFESLENQLNVLKSELEAKNNTATDYSSLKTKYKDFLKRIYFDNNSTSLNTESVQIVEDVSQILNTNDNIDVLIKGFASNKGSVTTNEKISMLRTEEVKKALMLKGIHPTRILTQYHGIDYSSKDETDARRVEVSLLVRK